MTNKNAVPAWIHGLATVLDCPDDPHAVVLRDSAHGNPIPATHVELLARLAIEQAGALDTAQEAIDGLLHQLAERSDELAALKAKSCATCKLWQPSETRPGWGGCYFHLGRQTPACFTKADHGCRSWMAK